MPRIYVDFNRLQHLEKRLRDVELRLNHTRLHFENEVLRLDWDVRYQSNINSTAKFITRKIEGYSTTLSKYCNFLNDANAEYKKLEEYPNNFEEEKTGLGPGRFVHIIQPLLPSPNPFNPWKKLIDFIGKFGNIGKIIKSIDSAHNANSWSDWAKFGLTTGQVISAVAKDVKNYAKIGNAIGTKNAVSYFLRKQAGLRTVGHASTAANPMSRLYNNLHNTTSPYNLSDAFAPLTGKNGVGKTVCAWAGVALTGVVNYFSNVEEQKTSNGNMSNARVVAETVTETAIDTVVTYGSAAVIGAAITTVTGAVAAPVVVGVAAGLAVTGINTGVKALTGKTATEWVSDAAIDTVTYIGDGIRNGAKAVGNWFSKLSFSW